MRRGIVGVVALAGLVVVASCKSKPPAPLAATPAQQASALQLGFAAGSFLAQYTQPPDARKESFGRFARSESDLYTFMGRLSIGETDSTAVVGALLDGFDDPNPERGGQLITQGVNDIMRRLSAGSSPELFWVFKIGLTLGYEMETVNVLAQGTPTEEHVRPFAVKTARYHETLQSDLDQAGLPPELVEAIQGANVEIRSVTDLLAITRACLRVKGLVAQVQ